MNNSSNEFLKERKFDLNERLIDFAVMIIELYTKVTKSPPGAYLAEQMMRSGISPSLHYGEAQGAESKKDFIHKLGILIKELRETLNAMTIINKSGLCNPEHLEKVIIECKELIAIFNKSIQTSRSNL